MPTEYKAEFPFDILGHEIKIGSIVVFPVQRSDSICLRVGRVTKMVAEPRSVTVDYLPGGTGCYYQQHRSWACLYSTDNIIVLE